ncbi:hypothetical protein MUP59_01275 [Candidatus Bathyarchaeota archaeon]|jgi:hypothetical protein|nr:hypothetical protein [Candidatus Bathyarchaeota archaeon]
MPFKPYRVKTALCYGTLLWIIGFVWGMIVFVMPPLNGVPSIPYVSKYPAISVPLMVLYVILSYFMAKSYLDLAGNRPTEGLKIGVTTFLLNILLDILIYVVLFRSSDYFAYISIWLTYAILIGIPWIAGEYSQK